MKAFNNQKINLGYDFVFSKQTLTGLMVLTGLVFLVSTRNRFIYIDDAFFGEQAYWLARDGVVKTVSLIDFLGCDVQLFSYHKLNILTGAALIRIFGWSVTPLRLTSLLIFVTFLVVFIRYFNQKFAANPSRKQQLTMALFFLVVNPLIVLYAFTYRPEIWVMFFGFLSFIWLDRNTKDKIAVKAAIVAGIFAGLALLTHLNGLIFLVAGVVLLLFKKQWRGWFWFSLAGGITTLLYFADLWQEGHLEAWFFQLSHWPDNNATNYLSENFIGLFMNALTKLSQEHQRFFWSPKVWGISAFFLLTLLFNFKRLMREQTNLMVYTITLILVLNIAGSQIAERFLIYLFPFMALIISFGLIRLVHETKPVQKAIFMLLLVVQLGTVGLRFADIFSKNAPHVQITNEILSQVPDKENLILVPYNMVFNALDQYPLASFKAFEYKEVAQGHPFTQSEFFKRTDDLGIQSIVIPLPGLKNTDTGLSCFNDGSITDSSLYHQHYRDKRCVILVKNQ